MKKGKFKIDTPRVLQEKTRYQGIYEDQPANQNERRAIAAIQSKVKNQYFAPNVLNSFLQSR